MCGVGRCVVRLLRGDFQKSQHRQGFSPPYPNYDSVSIREALELLRQKKLFEGIMVDCSHDNSKKDYRNQGIVWQDVLNQRIYGNKALIGLMLESNLNEGNQKNTGDLSAMKYGVSITDSCISWEATEQLLISAHKQLSRQ